MILQADYGKYTCEMQPGPVIAVSQTVSHEIFLVPGIRYNEGFRTGMSPGFKKKDQATQWSTSRTTDQRGSVAAGISPSTQ